MCSVGEGDFNIEIEKMEVTRYECKDCGNKFDSMGDKVVCPSCLSENVVVA
ncbi:MAG: hypothetical protein ACNYVW_04465 [Methanosarcinales archaeon]